MVNLVVIFCGFLDQDARMVDVEAKTTKVHDYVSNFILEYFGGGTEGLRRHELV